MSVTLQSSRVKAIELFYYCCTEAICKWTDLTLGNIPSQLAFKTYLHHPRINKKQYLPAQAHTKKHISVPGALASVILYLPLFLRYSEETLEDKQSASQKHCSQEKVTGEQKGQFQRVLSLCLPVMH